MATIVPVPKKEAKIKAKITELNDYCPVALTSVIMKCFERLVKDHITSTLPATLDPLQFAYRPNRSTDDAIAITLHTALSQLDKRNTYVRMLFIDYTIVPSKLIIKLEALGLNPALCNWVLDFLTGRPQVLMVGNNISTSLTLNTGAPQRCVLSPLLYALFTHDCVAMHASNSIIKFADNTTVEDLITNNDETAYREEVRALGVWCQENNLSLNLNKTKEMIVDIRKQQREQPPIHIEGAEGGKF
jgi:gmma-aminobutyric acid receptor subunit gamma/cGMP-dependent protein kinase 2